MKKKLFVKRILSIVITIALLISAVPVSLAVQNFLVKETTSKIVREVTELREESVKHFLCEDGSYIAATYSEPVHFFENGQWKEINNELALTNQNLSSSGKATYSPKENGISISIPQTFSEGQQITAAKGDYEIKFSLDSGNSEGVDEKTAAIVSEIETLPSNLSVAKAESIATDESSSYIIESVEVANEKMMEVENKSGAVVYKDVLPNTDLEYIITGCSIKENIVVHKSQEEYSYTFDIDIGDLISVKNENGSISLYETKNSENPVFYINAPYMYDSNGIESPNVEMSLIKISDKTKLVLTADKEWINSPDRVFPVVIDPTFSFGNSAFEDVFVMDGAFANSTRIGNELRVGTNLTNTTRTYIKMVLPTNIPRGSEVTSASLTLKKDSYFQSLLQDDIKIYAYDGKDADAWSATNVTWNNQPNFSFDAPHILDKIEATKDKTTYTFDILDAVSRWIEYGENNGICIKSSNEGSKTQIDFHSSRVSDTSNRPVMTFSYLLPGLSMTSLNLGPNAAFSPTINVTAAPEYEIRCSESWLSPTSKTDSSFKLHVTKNDSAYTRTATATIILRPYGDVIGTVTVTQLGSEPNLMVDTESWNVFSGGGEKSFVVTSNATWSIEVVDENNEDVDWIHVPNGEVTGTATITVSAEANTQNAIRCAILKIKSDELEEKIYIVQYDEFSEIFVQSNIDNSISLKSSSDYNHPLASWSMALSYASYNPVENELFPGIPSGFMHPPFDDKAKTAEAELESVGFDATSYNYKDGYSGYAAHTIGHRDIIVNENQIDGGNTNVSNNTELNRDMLSNNVGDSGINNGIRAMDSRYDLSDISLNNTNSDIVENESFNVRSLIVVSVRGSVTPLDWAMDLATQFNVEQFNFEVGCQEILDSLDEYLLSNSDYIKGEPIILITGHSLGAAIANLVAAELNNGETSTNVYAYTFATPNTVNAADGNEPTNYTNIFNILNNNDSVPHFPMDFFENVWTRHGIDFHITMPWITRNIELFDVDMLGVLGHGMPTYYSWMNNLPALLIKSAEDITVDDLNELSVDFAVGLVAKIFKAKCPVSVTMYDSNGNIVACESQQEGYIYPEVTDIGIASWISENGEKMFLIPYGSEAIDVHIEAYDYGTMNLTVEQLSVGEPLNTVTYNNVSLYPDKEFLIEVSEDVLPEDTQLFVTENGEIVGEVTETDPHLKSVTVTHEEKIDRVVTYKTFVTDNTVTEIRYIYVDPVNNTTSTSYLTPELSVVKIVEDGDNLIWTRGDCYLVAGDYVYDVVVISGDEMFTYKNAFVIRITEEMAATNQEYYSSVQSQSSSEELLQTYPIDDTEFVSESNTINYEIPYIVNDNL